MTDREWRLRLRIDELTNERDHWRDRYNRRTPLLDRWVKRYRWMKQSRDGWKLRHRTATQELHRLRRLSVRPDRTEAR